MAVLRHAAKEYLGCFATEEAALTVARFLGPEGVAAALAADEAKLEARTDDGGEAHATAAAEGLALVCAEFVGASCT